MQKETIGKIKPESLRNEIIYAKEQVEMAVNNLDPARLKEWGRILYLLVKRIKGE